MRSVAVLFAVLALPAAAQQPEVFGTGKPPVFREETLDRRFQRSRLAKLLSQGTDDAACLQLVGGLFTALGELAPMLHKRDENFVLDPALQEALNTQLTTPAFPAMAYLVAMVRRVMIDKQLPDDWFETAKVVNERVKIIDLAKLRLLNDGLLLADSAYFTLPVLRERFAAEVRAVTSAATTDPAERFRDSYLDRDVVWAGARLLDAGLNAPKGKKKTSVSEAAELVAILEWMPPDPRQSRLEFLKPHAFKPEPIRIIAKLAPKQYLDLDRLTKGHHLLVKGRFWEFNQTLTEVLVRDALLFEDRDFSAGVVLANPLELKGCPAAINELTGLSPQQPGGFRH